MVKRHYGIRTKRYKLIHFYHDVDEWELYDLEKDPNEMNNVIDDPAYSDVKKRLKEELDSLMKQYGDSDSLRQEMLKKDLNR
jgi:arylsulfatase A-like enzyme